MEIHFWGIVLIVTGRFVLRSVEVNPSRWLQQGELDQNIIPKLTKAYNKETVEQRTGNEDFRVKLAILHEAIKGVMSQYGETEQLIKSR